MLKDKADLLRFLDSFINLEVDRRLATQKKQYRLAFMHEFLEHLSHPERDWKLIHVAGTNGKGSLCCQLSRILVAHRKNVGLFTSPHLLSVCERIAWNNQAISWTTMVVLANQFQSILDQMHSRMFCHFFDVLTCLAILFFIQKPCDYIIWEVGLGGRLDSTNCFRKYLSKIAVLQPIGWDHMQVLGSSLKEIAREKIGILHQKDVLVLGAQPLALYALFQKWALEKNAAFFVYGEDFGVDSLQQTAQGLRFRIFLRERTSVHGASKRIISIKKTQALAREQAANIATATFVSQLCGIKLQESLVQDLFENYQIPARLQKYQDDPTILLDGAHNVSAMKTLVANLKQLYPQHHPKIAIFGISEGKDYLGMLETMNHFFDIWIVTRLPVLTKGDISKAIFKKAQTYSSDVFLVDCFEKALEKTQQYLKSPTPLVLVTGSFYLVGEALYYLNKKSNLIF